MMLTVIPAAPHHSLPFRARARLRVCFVALAVAACQRSPTSGALAGQAASANVAPSRPRVPSAALVGEEACRALNRDNERVVAATTTLELELLGRVKRAVLGRSLCVASASGAWGIRIGALKADANEGGRVWGRWSLVHVLAGGAATSATFEPAEAELSWGRERDVHPTAPVLFDFDGDGLPEALVVVLVTETTEGGTSYEWREGRLWSYRASRIQAYAPARDIVVESMADVDRDGRPDLFTRGPYSGFASIECGSGDRYPVRGPLLVAHALTDGAFAGSDAVARSAARGECPSLPRPVLVGSGLGIDFTASARNLACARLWGHGKAALEAEIAGKCSRAAPGVNCPPCDNPQLLRAWSTLAPPLDLR